ncbi:hypothetical protein L3073_03835 [Ancylomarina sp. DW003]|nr:hypothetical protein [Ancylomarina sp. DW003]MDE5421328.1 hypothetical protein [Ancylomarina sp. DW003]
MKQIQIVTLLFLMIISNILFAQEKKKVTKQNGDTSIEAAYMKANKKTIDAAKPMIEFFLKYDEKDNSKTPKQADFDLLIKQMGLSEEVKNDGSGLTKEDAFQLINAYIKANKKSSDADYKTKNTTNNDLLNKEIKKAEAQFEELKPEIEKFMKEAQKEAKKNKYKEPVISYQDFRQKAKTKKPELSEIEIEKAYKELMKAMGHY